MCGCFFIPWFDSFIDFNFDTIFFVLHNYILKISSILTDKVNVCVCVFLLFAWKKLRCHTAVLFWVLNCTYLHYPNKKNQQLIDWYYLQNLYKLKQMKENNMILFWNVRSFAGNIQFIVVVIPIRETNFGVLFIELL